jgi:hypothetical protein
MRTAPEPEMVHAVEQPRLRLVIDLDPGDPVCGSAGVEGESLHPFEGMLGFLSLFDRLRMQAGMPPDPRADVRESPH